MRLIIILALALFPLACLDDESFFLFFSDLIERDTAESDDYV